MAATKFEKHLEKLKQHIKKHPDFGYTEEDFERYCSINSFRFYFDSTRDADTLIIVVNDLDPNDMSQRNVDAVYEFNLHTGELLSEDYPM